MRAYLEFVNRSHSMNTTFLYLVWLNFVGLGFDRDIEIALQIPNFSSF